MVRERHGMKRSLVAGGLIALALSVSGCEILTGKPYGTNPSGKVVLPAKTKKVHTSAERSAQLRTTTYTDDHPELTGAPGPDGRWPAKVGNTNLTTYMAEHSLIVGSEGPGAVRR